MGSRLTDLSSRICQCELCPRLVTHRRHTARVKRRAYRDEDYWARPVPGFGRANARVVIVGLAPGAHGANRTGRMFTGDASGDFLFGALFRAGLASQPHSASRTDGLQLIDCYITAAVRCVPPDNQPNARERANCRHYLSEELKILRGARVYLCLGKIAFDELLRALGMSATQFRHGRQLQHQGRHIVGSYHVSRRNTQTGKLSPRMFDEILYKCTELAQMANQRPQRVGRASNDLTSNRRTATLK